MVVDKSHMSLSNAYCASFFKSSFSSLAKSLLYNFGYVSLLSSISYKSSRIFLSSSDNSSMNFLYFLISESSPRFPVEFPTTSIRESLSSSVNGSIDSFIYSTSPFYFYFFSSSNFTFFIYFI